MQINTVWTKSLAHYGYTIHDLQYNACLNVNAGTWILAQSLANDKMLWHGVGDYHSHAYALNVDYQYKVNRIYQMVKHQISN